MFRQPRTAQQTTDAKPWSPLSVSVITLLIPAGGAVLAIRNLQRLGQLSSSVARQLTWAVLGVFTLGFLVLFLVASKDAHGLPSLDANAQTVLSGGVAMVAYAAQRAPFRAWRANHATIRPSSWFPAAGMAIVFQVLTILVAVILYFTIYLSTGGTIS